MAFDPVPWAIGGGAEHSDELLRVAANAWSRDSQGIILPGDMKVTQLGSPGPGVTIADGGVIIRNRQAPGQSYVGRAASATQINPASTGGSTRHDLVVARIIDPDFSPWVPYTIPAQIAHGPYFEPYIVAGVPAGTTRASDVVSYSAYELCRIDIPPSTTNFTDAMIVDLRRLAQPRIGFAYDVQQESTTDYVTLSETSWHDWPVNSLQVEVPRWATHAQVDIYFSYKVGGSTHGTACDVNMRVYCGGATGPTTYIDYNGNSGTPAGFVEVLPHRTYGEFNVVAAQEDVITIKPQAMRAYTNNTGDIWSEATQQIAFDVRFSERAV